MAAPNSFYEQFLNDLAEQLPFSPGGENPAIQRLMQDRFRQMSLQRQREGLGQMEEDGSYRMRGNRVFDPELGQPRALPNEGGGLLDALGSYLSRAGQRSPVKRFMDYAWREPTDEPYSGLGLKSYLQDQLTPENLLAVAMSGKGGGRAGHGAAVRAEVLAKRAAKGPRKGSGSTPQPKYPPKSNGDLVDMLAKSLPKEPVYMPKRSLKDMLGRLRRVEK